MKEIHLWNFIYSELKKNNNVILAAVIDHEKGSPGKQGFKMAVTSNSETLGSIGGGVMEYDFLKKCRKAFKDNIILNEIETLHHKKTKTLKNSGLICSGSQTNFIFATHNKHNMKSLFEYLKTQKVFIRYFSLPRIENYVRITIGTNEEMDIFLEKTKEFILNDNK